MRNVLSFQIYLKFALKYGCLSVIFILPMYIIIFSVTYTTTTTKNYVKNHKSKKNLYWEKNRMLLNNYFTFISIVILHFLLQCLVCTTYLNAWVLWTKNDFTKIVQCSSFCCYIPDIYIHIWLFICNQQESFGNLIRTKTWLICIT